MTKTKTQIKTVLIKECVPNWWNPNEMNARQFTSLKKALTKYGQTKPIQVGVWPNMKVKGGYVIVGINHDTGEFAVASIGRWWKQFGKERYGKSKRILITADSGGSNGYRLKLWKRELQSFADKTGLAVAVCHLPPGTSKWNKIEHKLFSFISINWRGRPLTSYQVIIKLIAATKTESGLKVYAELDDREYQLKRQVSDEEMEGLNLTLDDFHGEWNYSIKPRQRL